MTVPTSRFATAFGERDLAPCVAAAMCALALGAFMVWGSSDFCLDDAWIHLAYAKSLKLGDGFSYNPGDHQTGFSSPLWVALLALCPWRSIDDPVTSVKLLGVCTHALLAWGTARLAADLAPAERARAAAWVAGALAACDPLLLFAAASGMEVTLAATLLVFTLLAICRNAKASVVPLAAASVWARPECLFVLAGFAALRQPRAQSASAWIGFAGASAALLAWMAYSQWATGYPWPNTYYAKQGGQFGVGLLYFVLQVLPLQAWSFGLTGLGLFAVSLIRKGDAQRIAAAMLVAVVAIAASRHIIPGVLFYCSRYFAVLGALPCAVIASQLPVQTGKRLLLLLPIALANVVLLPQARALSRAQESSIHRVHTEPARYLAQTLPPEARLAVEGAGTTRFFAPRTTYIIDVLGLNSTTIVHTDGLARLCTIIRERPTHVLLPEAYYASFTSWFELQPMRQFVDHEYAMSRHFEQRRLTAARVLGLTDLAHRRCRL